MCNPLLSDENKTWQMKYFPSKNLWIHSITECMCLLVSIASPISITIDSGGFTLMDSTNLLLMFPDGSSPVVLSAHSLWQSACYHGTTPDAWSTGKPNTPQFMCVGLQLTQELYYIHVQINVWNLEHVYCGGESFQNSSLKILFLLESTVTDSCWLRKSKHMKI